MPERTTSIAPHATVFTLEYGCVLIVEHHREMTPETHEAVAAAAKQLYDAIGTEPLCTIAAMGPYDNVERALDTAAYEAAVKAEAHRRTARALAQRDRDRNRELARIGMDEQERQRKEEERLYQGTPGPEVPVPVKRAWDMDIVTADALDDAGNLAAYVEQQKADAPLLHYHDISPKPTPGLLDQLPEGAQVDAITTTVHYHHEEEHVPYEPKPEPHHAKWQRHPHYYTAGEGDPGPGALRYCGLCAFAEGHSLHHPVQLPHDIIDALYYLRADAIAELGLSEDAKAADVLSTIAIVTKGPICAPPPPDGEPHELHTLWGHPLQSDPELEGATVQFRHTNTGEVLVEGRLEA